MTKDIEGKVRAELEKLYMKSINGLDADEVEKLIDSALSSILSLIENTEEIKHCIYEHTKYPCEYKVMQKRSVK